MSNIELKKANQMAAIDLLIHNPELTKRELAKELKVTPQTIHGWFADDRFVDMYYKKYMVDFNSKLPMVLNSMIREATMGNVQAGRLVLEHSGKLVKNINKPIKKIVIIKGASQYFFLTLRKSQTSLSYKKKISNYVVKNNFKLLTLKKNIKIIKKEILNERNSS